MQRLVPMHEETLKEKSLMPCISPDGKPTSTGAKMLQAIKEGAQTPEEVAQKTGLPLYRARSGLRELKEAQYLQEEAGKYQLTEKAQKTP